MCDVVEATSYEAILGVRSPERPPSARTCHMPSASPTNDRLYDRDFLLALASQMSFVIANTLMAHYSRWIEFLGGDVGQVGWIMGAGAVLGLLLRPWMGQAINRLGAKSTWLIGYGVFAVGSCGNLLVDDLGLTMYFLRSCLVLGAALVFTSSLTYITKIAPVKRQAEAIGILGSGGFLGMLFGPALGDLILSADIRVRSDFVVLFVSAGLGSILPAILVCCMRTRHDRDRASSVKISDFFRTAAHYWPGAIILVNVAFGFCMTVPFVFLASYVDQLKLAIPGVSVIGLFFWCYAGWGIVVRVGLRRVPDRWGRRKVLLTGMSFLSAGMFCFLLVDTAHAEMIALPALLAGTGHALIFHTTMSLSVASFPTEVRGTGSALALVALDLGTIIGAPLLGRIAESYGFHAMFLVIGGFSLAATIVYAMSSVPVWRERFEQRRTAAFEAANAVVAGSDYAEPELAGAELADADFANPAVGVPQLAEESAV